MNFAVLGISPPDTSEGNKEVHESFSSCSSQDSIFFQWDRVLEKVEKGVNLHWEVRHWKEKKIRKKPEASIPLSVFMGLGIYGAVWMFFSGMSGLFCTPVIGCDGTGAPWPAVKSTVKENSCISFLGDLIRWCLSFCISSLPSVLPSDFFCQCVCLLARGSDYWTEGRSLWSASPCHCRSKTPDCPQGPGPDFKASSYFAFPSLF